MRKFPKPCVIVSKCLEFDACRYNGQLISDDFVKNLQKHVKFVPVCPEVEIGLGIPRDPIRIVSKAKTLRLWQPATGLDLTKKMTDYSRAYLNGLRHIDGFILKSRSPSCGPKDVKFYSEGSIPAGKTSGFFAREVLTRFPNLAIEDEGRLRNFTIREHFLTKLFTLASFRQAKKLGTMNALVSFQSENKLMLMSYSQKALRSLGQIAANRERQRPSMVFKEYEETLHQALYRIPKYTSNINVLMHALGYFSKTLSKSEKAFFLDTLEEYRARRIPLSTCLGIMKSWIVRFGQEYLDMQTYFEPYPNQLLQLSVNSKQ